MADKMKHQVDFFAGKSLEFVGNWLAEKNLAKLKRVFEGKKPDEMSQEEKEKEEQSEKGSSTATKKGEGKEYASLPDVVNGTRNEVELAGFYCSDKELADATPSQAEKTAKAATTAAAVEAHGSTHQDSTDGAVSNEKEPNLSDAASGESPNHNNGVSGDDVISNESPHSQESTQADPANGGREVPPDRSSGASVDGVVGNEIPDPPADPSHVTGEVPPDPLHADEVTIPQNPNSRASGDCAMSSEIPVPQGVNPADPSHVIGEVPPDPAQADGVVNPDPNSATSGVGVNGNEIPDPQGVNPADPSHVIGEVPPDPAQADGVVNPDPNSATSGVGVNGNEIPDPQGVNPADPSHVIGEVPPDPAQADGVVHPDPNSATSGVGVNGNESPQGQEVNPAQLPHANGVVPPEPSSEASGNGLDSDSLRSQELNNAVNADEREVSSGHGINAASFGGITESLNHNQEATVSAAANAAAAVATGAPQNPAEEAMRGVPPNSASQSGQEPVVAEAPEPPQSLTGAPIQEEGEEDSSNDDSTQQEAAANSYDHLNVSEVISKDKFLEDKLACALDCTSHRVIKTWEHLSCTDEINAPLETRLRCKLNRENSCTLMLIDLLAVVKGDKTVKDLIQALQAKPVGRNDVVKIIKEVYPDAENSTVKISDFARSDANSELIKKMATKLDEKSRVNGTWKELGQQFKISGEKLKEIECGQINPTLALMEYLYSKEDDLTVGKFYEETKKLGRNDVVKKLDPFYPARSGDPMKEVIEPESDDMTSICVCFNNKNRVLKNWRHLANAFKVPRDVYKDFNPEKPVSPTNLLFQWIYANKPDLTVGQLCKALQRIDRNDVVRDIGKHFEQRSSNGH